MAALKQLERALKGALLGAVLRLMSRRPLPPPDFSRGAWRVLYLRPDRIGDMIMVTGLLRCIASSHPTIELDVLASAGNAPVLEGNPHVRRVLTVNRKRLASVARAVRVLRRRRYDVVIDGGAPPSPISVTNLLLMAGSGARYRLGVSGRRGDAVFTLPVAPVASGRLMLGQMARVLEPFGVAPDGADLAYQIFLRPDEVQRAEDIWGPRAGRLRVLVNVSAFTADRRWPQQRFEALAADLRRKRPDARLLIIGDPGDLAVAEAVAAAGGAEAVDVTPVRAAFALVAAADALITPDTSLSHAAAAFGTPVATMFRSDWQWQAPLHASLVSIVSDGPRLEALPLDKAVRGVDQLLAMVDGER